MSACLDTGPLFNPSDAPFFDYSSIVFPTETQGILLPPTITGAFSVATTLSLPLATLSRSSTTRNSTSHSTSRSANSTSRSTSLSTSTTASRTSLITSSAQRSSATSTSATAAQSTAAAASNYQGVVGVVVGGLFAGLAMA
jgi:hypothetical protein